MLSKILKLAGLLSVFAVVLLFSNIKSASASTTDNIRGVAYNSSFGYIVFNCLDDGFAGRFPFTFEFTFNIPPCSARQYGVNLDANNNFSGEAWNTALGFIKFSASSTPSNAFRAKCDNGNTCTEASGCTACYNENDEVIYGYMYVKDYDEWISFDDGPSPTKISNYLSAEPGIFSGYASSSPTIGPISFNCTNEGTCINGGTGTNDYRVKIGPLEIRQMTAPNWGSNEACSLGANNAVLKWNRRSGMQTGYQVIVSTANSTTTGIFFDSGKISNTATQVSVSSLAYSTPYYWFLRLWDDTDTPTDWRQFNAIPATKDWVTDNYTIGDNPLTFTSYKHEFPSSLFTWTPTEITIATTTNSFVSNSSYYNISNPTSTLLCTSGNCNFHWYTSDAGATILSSTTASTSIEFVTATSTTVILNTSDLDAYTCATSTVLNVNYALPLWREIKPN